MSKNLLMVALVTSLAFQPTMASAMDLDDAFTNLLTPGGTVSVNAPGQYQSGARNSFVAGGMEMRVPKSNSSPQLFSVTPPRISAGCNGISAHFGGFSFISGAEFEQMLKSIASGAALGFVSMMTMKTLCPPCEAVVQFLKTAAQQAARLSKDSCQWGRELASKFMSGDATQSNTMEVCGSTLSTNGTSSDYLSLMNGINGACGSLTKAVDALVGENAAANSSPDAKAQLQCSVGVGNVTWQRLKAFDVSGAAGAITADDTGYRRKLLLLNMLGAQLSKGGSNDVVQCETYDGGEPIAPTENEPTKFCAPTLRPADVVGLFMCGTPVGGKPPGTSSNRVIDYCRTFYEAANNSPTGSYANLASQRVYKCSGDLATCNNLAMSDTSVIVQGEGFLTQINKTLLQGVDAVRRNEKMPDNVLKLMQVAPYPLYQAINAAAVYPSAAEDLIDAMSILVAEQTTISYLDDALRLEGRASSGAAGCLSDAQARTILEAVSTMRAANRARLQQLAQNITVQETLSEQIRTINLAIQRQVLNQDMLANGRFGEAVGKALSPNVSKGNSGTPTATPTP